MMKSHRIRLDRALVQQGIAESLSSAQAMILAGEVRLDGKRADKAGAPVARDARIEVVARNQKYASRGGLKLEGALEDFHLDPRGKICLDIGASTGGFTDCLLQHGAAKIFAVDVTISQLAWKLQQDQRVIPIERNARALTLLEVPEPAALVVMDVSFISITKVLPSAIPCAAPSADFLILIKPQFELRRADVPPGGIITDPRLHQKAIDSVQQCAVAAALRIQSVFASRLTGAEGNQEFFLHARKPL